jgi:hydroxypyruvate reductase
LILSDVIGNRLEHIGSGPTVPVVKVPDVGRAILDRFDVWKWLEGETAALVERHLEKWGLTPQPQVTASYHMIIGDVSTATRATAERLTEWGFEAVVVSNGQTGEAREIGRMAAEMAKGLGQNHCLIWGGESTVTIRGNGKGGRNQEIALAAALALDGAPDCLVLAFSTDGEDGPVPVAGAFVTGKTVVEARAMGLEAADYLERNDSYTFFERLGWGHLTAEKGTNVNDVLIVLKLETR